MFKNKSDTADRRNFLKCAALAVVAVKVGTATKLLTPRQARAEAIPYQVLNAEQVKTLEALGDTLLPGAAAEGIAHFVDSQLAVDPGNSLLMLRYADVPPPFAPFYQDGITAFKNYAIARFEQRFSELEADARKTLVAEIASANPADWSGPPAPLFYFVVRADAVDVVYGTVAGFDKLGIPYLPHIYPPSRW
jgi:hypothetical protein